MAVAALLAVCAGCSSPDGQVACKSCGPPVTVALQGFDGLAGDGARVRICISDKPCSDFRVHYEATDGSVSCGQQTACVLDQKSGALHVTLDERDASRFDKLPVWVTASSKKGQWNGTGMMRYVPGRKPCACPHSDGQITLT